MKKGFLFISLFHFSLLFSDFDVLLFDRFVSDRVDSISSLEQLRGSYKEIRQFESEFQKFYLHEIDAVLKNAGNSDLIMELKNNFVNLVPPFSEELDNYLQKSTNAILCQGILQKIILSRICNGIAYIVTRFDSCNLCPCDFDYFKDVISNYKGYVNKFIKKTPTQDK